MSMTTLCSTLKGLTGKFVQIYIKGSIVIPIFIEKFEFLDLGEYICFGEDGSENFPFEIYKYTIEDLTFISNEENYIHIEFKLTFDIFVTYIHIVYEN